MGENPETSGSEAVQSESLSRRVKNGGVLRPLSLLSIVACTSVAQADEDKCRADHKAMLQGGVVSYGEVVIDLPIEAVWAALPAYYEWRGGHETNKRTTIKGESGQVGEVVEIALEGDAASLIYVETIRIRPLQTIDGAHKVGNVVFRVYDRDVCFSKLSDFGVREYHGKTILYQSMYEEPSPSSDKSFVVGRDFGEHMAGVGERIKEYVRKGR